MQFRPGIEINDTLLVPFSEYDALPFGKIDVAPVEFYQFSYTHTGGCKHVNDGKIPPASASVTKALEIFVGNTFLYLLSGLDLVNAPYRALDDKVLIFKP